MKKVLSLLVATLMLCGYTLRAETVCSFQNCQEGCSNCNAVPCLCPPSYDSYPSCSTPYCQAPTPPCDPCAPCAPACGLNCGVSLCAIGVAVLAIVGAAALILSSEHVHTTH